MNRVKRISQIFHPYMKRKQKIILAVFAHPDDEALQVGGLLAKAAMDNIQTYLLCLSKGEKGYTNSNLAGTQLKIVREKELMEAGKILGIKKIFHFDIPDGNFFSNQDRLKIIINRVVEKVKPEIIITHDPTGITGHPDHITTSLVVKSLLTNYYSRFVKSYFVVLGEREKKLRQKMRGKTSFRFMPPTTHCIDIRAYSGIKARACLVYKSQHLGELLPVPLKIWFTLFDKEYLHFVDLRRQYRFKYKSFNSKGVKFTPTSLNSYLV